MVTPSKKMLLLKGEPKTTQVESIRQLTSTNWSVRFKQNDTEFSYHDDKVIWLTNPKWLDPNLCKVFRNGQLQHDVTDIWQYEYNNQYYWHIRYQKGYEAEYTDRQMKIEISCLNDKTAKSTFNYMCAVAEINPLGKNESESGILTKLYESISFVDPTSAAACYLTPDKYPPKTQKHDSLIYPFGCNASQKQAVAEAFEHQISVIQGPPGTGKTQTILNIIANIVTQGKTVMIVSNNNAATTNVQEKLAKYGLSFIVASLGKKANKDFFIDHQPEIPEELTEWKLYEEKHHSMKEELRTTLQQLDKVYVLQNRLAALRQEQQAIELEWKHFCQENEVTTSSFPFEPMSSDKIIKRWLQIQYIAEEAGKKHSSLLLRIKLWWIKLMCKYRWGINRQIEKNDVRPLVSQLQAFYYETRRKELSNEIAQDEAELEQYDATLLTETLADNSLKLFKLALNKRYEEGRVHFLDLADLQRQGDEFMKQYPVVLSTTFSACTCMINNKLYDYIIMDEASQVSVETGTLALCCARNAVIVGDNQQLPNVITETDRIRLATIKESYHIADGYDSAYNSFLRSVCQVMTQVPQTMLREHYRCHPRIINFCNQKFYGGNLLIMTTDHNEPDVLCAFRTVKGNHAVNQYNQREIDVIQKEVLHTLTDYNDIAIVTPYNHQVDQFNQQLPEVEAATIHKYQGREKEAIIMSTVDNKITAFADDAQLLNVAVSRAKSKFCLVMTGNEQENHGNLIDLLEYIHYNNCTITESKIASIFDYLYEQYTEQRMELLASLPKISEFASENLTYYLINDVIESDARFACFKVLNHIPLREIIHDTSLLSPDELAYISHNGTHVDFLVINNVSKKPMFGVETDSFSFHHEETEQHQRDKMKDNIFKRYALPLIRLSTRGSGEREIILAELLKLV